MPTDQNTGLPVGGPVSQTEFVSTLRAAILRKSSAHLWLHDLPVWSEVIEYVEGYREVLDLEGFGSEMVAAFVRGKGLEEALVSSVVGITCDAVEEANGLDNTGKSGAVNSEPTSDNASYVVFKMARTLVWGDSCFVDCCDLMQRLVD